MKVFSYWRGRYRRLYDIQPVFITSRNQKVVAERMRMSGDDKTDVSGGKEMDSDGFICRHIRRLKCIIELLVNNAVYAVSIVKLPFDKTTVLPLLLFSK